MKNTNIVGEPFAKYVNDQIEQRQKVYGSGLTSSRDPKHIQYLNSRLSWVKMISSVVVNPTPGTKEVETIIKTGEDGTFRLKKLGLDIEQFKGYKLASSFILFNGVQQGTYENYINTTNNPDNTKTDPTVTGKFTEYVKRAGISTTNSNWNSAAYGLGGTNFGLQPMPGINSLEVKSLNRGSIRKATITLKAYNKFQFEVINTLYLRLGFNMLLEWGNSHYIESSNLNAEGKASSVGNIDYVRNTLTEDVWFNEEYAGSTNLDLLQTIEKYRKKYDGNYDGFMGRVTNFSWDYKPDGSYDISIELASLGDVIESLKVNVFTDTSNFNVSQPENTDTITTFLNKLSQNPDSFNTKDNSSNFLDLQKLSEIKDYRDYPTIPEDLRYYIRFGNLLEFIEKHILIHFSNGGDKTFPILNIDYNPERNVMPIYPNQISLDPKICLIKTHYFSPPSKTNLFFYKPMVSFSSTGDPYGKIMNIYLNFKIVKDKLKSNIDNKGNLSLFDFVKALCDQINKAFGGVSNLEPIIVEDKNTMVFLDQNNYPNRDNIRKKILEKEKLEKEEETSFPIDLFGYNINKNSSNFVKNFSLKTEIDPKLASMITIGATANGQVVGEDATSFSQWNKGLTDRFKQFQSPPIPVDFPEPKKEKEFTEPDSITLPLWNSTNQGYETSTPTGLKKHAEKRINSLSTNFISYLEESFGEQYSGNQFPLNDKTLYTNFDRANYQDWVNLGKQSFNNYISQINSKNNKKGVTTSTLGFIPLKLQLTLDGLSGIKIYQKLKVNTDFLPSNYPDVLEFVITGIDHSLSDNQWATQVETISLPVVQEIPIESELSDLKAQEGLDITTGLLFSLPIQNSFGPPLIRNDKGGAGYYGANRSPLAGSTTPRKHTGVDFSTIVGQEIYAPIPGEVQITKATTTSKLNGIKIYGNGEYKGYTIYIFYSQLSIPPGTFISKGEKIGNALDLSPDYPKEVTNHIHFKIEENGQSINPENIFYEYNGQTLLGDLIFGRSKSPFII